MSFTAVITSTVLITVLSIFSVYKIFLAKPPAPVSSPIPKISALPREGQSVSESQASPFPSGSLLKSPAPSAGAILKPKSSSGNMIGSLTVLQKNTTNSPGTAPSLNTGSSTISGTINLVGSAPSGSTLVIAARPTDSSEQFKVVIDSITAQNNASWSWNQAQNGVRYDLFAVLKGKSGSVDIDYASSPSSTVKSPYQGQVLVVDTGYALSAPTGTITVICNTHTNDNKWLATVNYPLVNGAKMYKLQVGTTSGASDLVDSTKNAQTADAVLNANVVYYARYSVASVSNPTSYQYSAFSSPTPISC